MESIRLLVIVATLGFPLVKAQVDLTVLQGTWSSKSNAVFTGPDFYDPVDELLIEPALPGISYSFTTEGWFEEAIYQVTANPQNPGCPAAVMIFQHGTYEAQGNGIVLNPIQVDGRQLVSTPCNQTNAAYLRYNQTEIYQSFDVSIDHYYGRYRLDLYKFDGSPVAPLYLAYKPPQMLPTATLNPTAGAAQSTSVAKKIRRSLENRSKTTAVKHGQWDYNLIWWIGFSLICIGLSGWYFL